MKVEGLRRFNVAIDMDGVLADFDKRFIGLHGTTFKQAKKDLGDAAAWQIIIDDEDFWLKLEPMEGARTFFKDICLTYGAVILTAPPTRDIERAKIQKRLWIDEHIGKNVPVFFRRGRLKSNLASPDAILIDDMQENIDYWERAGGIGLLHTSAENTMEKLKQISDNHEGVIPIDLTSVKLLEKDCPTCGSWKAYEDKDS